MREPPFALTVHQALIPAPRSCPHLAIAQPPPAARSFRLVEEGMQHASGIAVQAGHEAGVGPWTTIPGDQIGIDFVEVIEIEVERFPAQVSVLSCLIENAGVEADPLPYKAFSRVVVLQVGGMGVAQHNSLFRQVLRQQRIDLCGVPNISQKAHDEMAVLWSLLAHAARDYHDKGLEQGGKACDVMDEGRGYIPARRERDRVPVGRIFEGVAQDLALAPQPGDSLQMLQTRAIIL